MTKLSVSISCGALSDPIAVQVRRQGTALTISEAKAFQKVADAITLLRIHSYIPESTSDRARKKLVKAIAKQVRQPTQRSNRA